MVIHSHGNAQGNVGPTLAVMVAAGSVGLFLLDLPALADGTSQTGGERPRTIEVTGVVRDFRERTVPEGHPDFEREPDHGFGRYSGNIATSLGPEDKPVFTGRGFRVAEPWTDAEGREICYALFDPSLGDQKGARGASDRGAIASTESFDQWFRDVPGVNLSAPLRLTLVLANDGRYVFDDREHELFRNLGGFFPIEGQLFGNPGGRPDRNFHFTFELHMEFDYDENGDQSFMFIGDDDVWVFIDGRMVIDLGGVHAARHQHVDLSRLGLEHGETYRIDFFFAERHRRQSNFRIETNIVLRTFSVPTITQAYD